MRAMRLRAVLFSIAAIGLLAAGLYSYREATWEVRETRLRTPERLCVYTMLVSPDGEHIAYSSSNCVDRKKADGSPSRVYLDGKPGKEYESILDPWPADCAEIVPGLFFSPTGGHLAYAARIGDKVCMVVDGKEGKLYDDLMAPSFSEDGTHIAYGAMKGDRWVMVVDGRESEPRDDLAHLGYYIYSQLKPVFSPDGRRLAYGAMLGDKLTLIVDGEASPPYMNIKGVTFSPDSKRIAYVRHNPGAVRVVVDGREGPQCQQARPPVFSPDGKHLAYSAVINGHWVMVVDGEVGGEYKAVHSYAFSPDSKRLALVVSPYGKPYTCQQVVLDTYELRECLSVRYHAFSPDGSRFAYAAKLDIYAWRPIIDGEEGPIQHGLPGPILFSPDSRHVAYKGKETVVRDGKADPTFSGYMLCGVVVWSPDSKHLAYSIRSYEDKTDMVVVDGVPGDKYNRIIGDGLSHDGISRNEAYVFFDGPDRLHYFVLKDGDVCRVDRRIR